MAKDPAPTRHWFHIPIQIIVAAFCIYWYWHMPPPNKAVLCLGGVAALMALVEMRPMHKAVYVLLIVALMFTENRAIDKDRRDFSDQEEKRRIAENQQFASIGTAITTNVQKLLDNSDNQFHTTLGKTNSLLNSTKKVSETTAHSLEAITGGRSWPNMRLSFGGPQIDKLGLVAELHDTQDAGEFSYEVDQEEGSGAMHCPFVGREGLAPIESSSTGIFRMMTRTPVVLSPAMNGVTHYRILMASRNGHYVQCLNVKFNPSTKSWDQKTFIGHADWISFIPIKDGSMTVGDWPQN